MISNFEMWSWNVIFIPLSEKVTCTKIVKKIHRAAVYLLLPERNSEFIYFQSLI